MVFFPYKDRKLAQGRFPPSAQAGKLSAYIFAKNYAIL